MFEIALDMDGTVVQHRFPRLGPPVPGAIEWIKKWQDEGAKIIVWTMRSDGQDCGNVLTDAVNYFKENNIELYGVNMNPNQDWSTSPKCDARVFVDDLSACCPLIYPEDGSRPYVDFSVVGPWVLEKIKMYNRGIKHARVPSSC